MLHDIHFYVPCLFCFFRQNNCWNYFAFRWTRLVQAVTWQVWKACPASLTMTSVKAQSHAWMMVVMVSGMVLQLTTSPWTTEASTRERWQFGALTNRKSTSSNRAPSTSSLYYFLVALSLYRDKWTTIIRLWWISQWLVTYGHHLVVTIYLHVAPSTCRHNGKQLAASCLH